MKNLFQLFVLFFSGFCFAQQDTLYIYGPGGPFEPMTEAAKIFSEKNKTPVKVVKGPFGKWKDNAKVNADIIYSGSEYMMTNFIKELESIDSESVYPLYLRKSGIIVRKGNPKKIKNIQDLLKSNINIMVVNGAGLIGIWEDIIGKKKNINELRSFRKNIVFYAENSGQAQKQWEGNKKIDAWISWNIWQKKNTEAADFIELDEKFTTYRDCGIALTFKGKNKKNAIGFYNFLKSKDVQRIFEKWGWTEN